MRRISLVLQLALIAAAALLALVPPPPDIVERYYADSLYPAVQASLTSWSNTTGFALFDLLLLFGGLAFVILWWRQVRSARRTRSFRPLLSAAAITVTSAAVLYIWFALVWGLNYARVPLEQAIGFDARRVSDAAVLQLAERAVERANAMHAAAHQAGFPRMGEMPPALVGALHDVERRLGRPRATTPGRPKRTLLAPFFRAATVGGMHAPFLLETLLNPDLTPAERPAVLAHEWAHLAGYAPEDDASFVGLLAALRADAASQYSAWLELVFDTMAQLPRKERERLLAKLEAGPRRDRDAILARLRSRVEVVDRVAWQAYDTYLKAQGIREGVRNYSRVVQLLVGSGALDW